MRPETLCFGIVRLTVRAFRQRRRSNGLPSTFLVDMPHIVLQFHNVSRRYFFSVPTRPAVSKNENFRPVKALILAIGPENVLI